MSDRNRTAETVMTPDERIALLEREVSAAQDRIEHLSLLNVEYAGKIDRLGTENVLPCWANHSAPWHRLSLRKGCAGCEIERLRELLGYAIQDWETHHGPNHRAEHWTRMARAEFDVGVPRND